MSYVTLFGVLGTFVFFVVIVLLLLWANKLSIYFNLSQIQSETPRTGTLSGNFLSGRFYCLVLVSAASTLLPHSRLYLLESSLSYTPWFSGRGSSKTLSLLCFFVQCCIFRNCRMELSLFSSGILLLESCGTLSPQQYVPVFKEQQWLSLSHTCSRKLDSCSTIKVFITLISKALHRHVLCS